MSIKDELRHIIKCSLVKLDINFLESEITIDICKDKNHGDYASNIALVMAKNLHKSPMEIANLIKDNIDSDVVCNVEVAMPGFINFTISPSYLLKTLDKILMMKNDYGRCDIGKNKKINLEFVSANPTGILHIGHGRGAVYGDSLARILNFIGYDVVREYYINDAGNQMNNLGISIKERYKELCGLDCNLPEDGYHGKEIIEIAKKIYSYYKDNKLDCDISFFKKEGLDILLDQIKHDLDTFRVNYEVFTSEQSLYDRGIVDNTLTKLKNSGNCYIEDGALWLKTTAYGDEKDRVLIKNDGNYTYLMPDIAYHIDKYERGFDKMIDVFGADHHGYINRLKGSLSMLGYDTNKLEVKILQMVRLIKDNQELKLSKRTGKTYTLMELIDDVGINAARFFFVAHSIDTQMDFDLDLATSQSNDNPIYYIEYANARISSILKSYKGDLDNLKYSTICDANTYIILNKLCAFEDVVKVAGEKGLPHLIANYVYELASLFHSYYANVKIITDDVEYTKDKIALLTAIKIVINNALNLIGIIPREEM